MENEKKLTRSSNRMIAGVCAGIAEYFGWDPTLLRRFLIKFRATYLCSITLFMAIPGYFKMHIAWIIYLLFLICRYPFIHQPFNELY